MSIISKERIAHMHGVAEFMFKHADKFDCKYLTKEELYHLGLIHDIGYVSGKEDHESNGASLFERDDMMYHCIFYHGTTPQEYIKNTWCYGVDDIPDELILLWIADMKVLSTGDDAGKIVSFTEKLNEIANYYGEDSIPYEICKDTIDWLSTNIEISNTMEE